MRAKITALSANHVTLSYDNNGERVTREFMCFDYVREWKSGQWQQICSGLSTRGPTLMAGKNLIDVIRREYKTFRKNRYIK